MEKVLEVLKKNSAGFVVEQCRIVEHACARTEMGPEGSNGDQRGLEGVQVQ